MLMLHELVDQFRVFASSQSGNRACKDYNNRFLKPAKVAEVARKFGTLDCKST